MSVRTRYVIANWKMNGHRDLVSAFNQTFANYQGDTKVIVCPPFTLLGSNWDEQIKLGAQNMSEHAQGAYTGEVSSDMLKELQVSYVIIGHSERRALYGESDQLVADKVQSAINNNLMPVLCVGETDEQREAGETFHVVKKQISTVIEKIGTDALTKVIIAYEPIWAIGTGKTATPAQAQDVHQAIRAYIAESNSNAASQISLLYGGSVNADNCSELFEQKDIDGGLVGGASLKPEDFHKICISV
ncbi:triose-phosphate isomerase [Algicola sagamiensis]|uniref:triose-phosphate isomerase n=1 Tax=Algicola sagamiensis TaxID=163869 RepID=UPI000367ABC5|nr:triose-phosphate isomerase [Algicola sagamiensis]